MKTSEQLNGVNLDAITQGGEAGRVDRATTRFSFSVNGTWQGGNQLVSTTGAANMGGTHDPDRAGRFTMVSDEPMPLGHDAGPNPVEYVLNALAACYTVGIATVAAQRGIALDGYTVDVEGDVDLAAFFGVDPEVAPGVNEIRVYVTLESATTSRDELEDLIRAVEHGSTVRHTLANPVEVITTLN